ncbi:hypothetical protein BBJ28_00000128 [Nothophytophthora sp. Chile5]|nr:hypothetical protein BBJ28_00000128 [Nothophytophthora sp. Chile5]
MLLRFTDDTFDDNLQSTIGVDFKVKMMQVDGKKIKMTIWDTAGQERFRTLTSSYYRGAQGIVLVYDVARRDTFENLDLWLQEVEVYSPAGGRDVVKLLVGNKIDKERVVSRREAEDWARSKGMLFVESSAKTKIGIQQVFNEVVQKVRKSPSYCWVCGLVLVRFKLLLPANLYDLSYMACRSWKTPRSCPIRRRAAAGGSWTPRRRRAEAVDAVRDPRLFVDVPPPLAGHCVGTGCVVVCLLACSPPISP